MAEHLRLTPKQEAFARMVIELGDKSAAYLATYEAWGMKRRTLHVRACELSKHPAVRARIEELMAEAAAEAKLSRAFIIEGLMRQAATAKEGSARVRAFELLGKTCNGGIFTDHRIDQTDKRPIEELRAEIRSLDRQRIGTATLSELASIREELTEQLALVRQREAEYGIRGVVGGTG
jgi:hypothetical protein